MSKFLILFLLLFVTVLILQLKENQMYSPALASGVSETR